MDERAAAEFLGMTPRFLQLARMSGKGPPYIRISARAIRYKPETLRAWLEERERTSTAAAEA
jgi:hypothetical protein